MPGVKVLIEGSVKEERSWDWVAAEERGDETSTGAEDAGLVGVHEGKKKEELESEMEGRSYG